MYCSICGNELSEHLNYCNHCGARTVNSSSEGAQPPSGWVAVSSALMAASGLFFAISLLRILLDSRLDTPAIVVILISYLIVVWGMFAVFIRHMSKGSKNSKTTAHELNAAHTYVPPASLRPLNTAQLEAAHEPGSITEHTTRTLDEIYVERK